MHKQGTNQTITAYIVAIALLFNALFATSAMAMGAAGSESVLLCTSQGYKWVELDENTASGEGQKHCELCLFPPLDDSSDALHHTTLADVSPSCDVNRYFVSEYDRFKHRFQNQLAQGRAPPLS